MKKIENKFEEEKMREYLITYIDLYCKRREEIGIPVDREKLENLIKEIDIELYENSATTGTFTVSQVEKFFGVIINNFKENGNDRNMFLLLHEMTHLSSEFNREYNEKINELPEFFAKFEKIKENPNMSEWDVIEGLRGIEEVLAQWCCEECNDKITGKRRDKKNEEHEILGNKINIKTNFSEHDIYAPLEEYVEDFAVKAGYKNMKDFAKAMITGEKSIFDLINTENAEALGYIGILYEGIYQENGFYDFELPSTDIPIAIKYLEERKKGQSLPDAPGEDR